MQKGAKTPLIVAGIAGLMVAVAPSASAQDAIEFSDRLNDFEYDDSVSDFSAVSDLRLTMGSADDCEDLKIKNSKPKLSMKGTFGGYYSTNAPQTEGGDPDFVNSPSVVVAYTRKSKTGSCGRTNTPEGDKAASDPDWILQTQLITGAQDYVDDKAGDASFAKLTTSFSTRLGSSMVGSESGAARNSKYNYKYRTRATISGGLLVAETNLFDQWVLSTFDAKLGVSHTIHDNGSSSSSLALAGSRRFANPKSASYNQVELSYANNFGAVKGFEKWSAAASATARYRVYDERLPDERRDESFQLGFTLTRKIGTGISLQTGLSAELRESNIEAAEYDAVSLPLSFKLSREF